MTHHFAEDYSVFMALVDLVPVVLFFLAGLILMTRLYQGEDGKRRMSAASYAMLSSGTLMVGLSGFLKSLWKILAALNIVDYVQLNLSFFVFQSFGFLFFALGLIPVLGMSKEAKAKGETTLFSSSLFLMAFMAATTVATEMAREPLVQYTGSVPFIALQTLGCATAQIILCIAAFRIRNTKAGIAFVISFVTMWGMGFLAAMDGKMSVTLWNWLEEIVNSVSQGALLLGVMWMKKK